MRVGFIELGRALRLKEDRDSHIANNPRRLLLNLATRRRDITWVVVGRNSGGPLPENVENPWEGLRRLSFDEVDEVAVRAASGLDGLVVYVNQTATVSRPIPKRRGEGTVSPLQFARRYAASAFLAINTWQDEDLDREPVYLVSDPRSPLRARDLKWPPRRPLLCQHDFVRQQVHYRYGDGRSPAELGYDATWDDPEHWRATHRYVYSGLELEELGEEKLYVARGHAAITTTASGGVLRPGPLPPDA